MFSNTRQQPFMAHENESQKLKGQCSLYRSPTLEFSIIPMKVASLSYQQMGSFTLWLGGPQVSWMGILMPSGKMEIG